MARRRSFWPGGEVGAAAHEAVAGLLRAACAAPASSVSLRRAPSQTALTRANSFSLRRMSSRMRGQHRGDLPGDGLQRVVGLGRRRARRRRCPPRRAARRRHPGLQGVGEGRRLGVGDDGVDLLALRGHGRLEGGQEVLGLDGLERRHAEGRLPLRKERVGRGGRLGRRAGERRQGREDKGEHDDSVHVGPPRSGLGAPPVGSSFPGRGAPVHCTHRSRNR